MFAHPVCLRLDFSLRLVFCCVWSYPFFVLFATSLSQMILLLICAWKSLLGLQHPSTPLSQMIVLLILVLRNLFRVLGGSSHRLARLEHRKRGNHSLRVVFRKGTLSGHQAFVPRDQSQIYLPLANRTEWNSIMLCTRHTLKRWPCFLSMHRKTFLLVLKKNMQRSVKVGTGRTRQTHPISSVGSFKWRCMLAIMVQAG